MYFLTCSLIATILRWRAWNNWNSFKLFIKWCWTAIFLSKTRHWGFYLLRFYSFWFVKISISPLRRWGDRWIRIYFCLGKGKRKFSWGGLWISRGWWIWRWGICGGRLILSCILTYQRIIMKTHHFVNGSSILDRHWRKRLSEKRTNRHRKWNHIFIEI